MSTEVDVTTASCCEPATHNGQSEDDRQRVDEQQADHIDVTARPDGRPFPSASDVNNNSSSMTSANQP